MSDSVELLRSMLRVRRFEERCVELYSQTKIRGFLHVYIGEEAVATGVMSELEPDDAVVATYREHGHALLKGMSARKVIPPSLRIFSTGWLISVSRAWA